MKIDETDLIKLTTNLRKAHRSAYPLAVRSTLDRMAYLTRETSRKHIIPNRFTIRKKSFTRLTIGSQRCKNTFIVKKMSAQAGQFAYTKGQWSDQYQKQEMSGEEKPRKKYLFTPTKAVRAGSYAKTVRKGKYLNAIDIKKPHEFVRNVAKDKKTRGRQAIAVAYRTKMKDPFFAQSESNKQGVFKVSGKKANLWYKMDEKNRKVKRRQWLSVATDRVLLLTDKIFKKEGERRLAKVLKRGLKS